MATERVLGIDPGLERLGIGLVDREGSRLTCVHYGLVQTPRIALPDRLELINGAVEALVVAHRPDRLVTERQLFTLNKTNALDVAKALGVVLRVAGARGLAWREFSPPEVKQAVAGYGRAEKHQVAFMVARLLALPEPPRPDDVTDALAVAITGALHGPG